MKRIFFPLILGLIIIILNITYFVIPQIDFSNKENRLMNTFSSLDLKHFFDSGFQTDLEESLKDQFPQRDPIIEAVTSFRLRASNMITNIALRDIEDTYDEVLPETEANLPDQPEEALTIAVEPDEKQNLPYWARPEATPDPDAVPTPLPTPQPTDEPGTYRLKAVGGNYYQIVNTQFLIPFPVTEKTDSKERLQKIAGQVNNLAEHYPDIKVFVYYVLNPNELNWFDKTQNIKAFDYGDYLLPLFSDRITTGRNYIPDMETLEDQYFKTDHHWNYKGAYQAYTQIYEMFSRFFELSPMKIPTATLEFPGLKWYGSYIRSVNITKYYEEFKAYEYDLGEYEAYFGNEKKEIGLMQEYKEGKFSSDPYASHYMDYYGYENNIVKMVFPSGERNLLIIGDSNTRAIRRVISSHFRTTVFADYRAFTGEFKTNFDLNTCIANEKIDTILFLARRETWENSGFNLRGY